MIVRAIIEFDTDEATPDALGADFTEDVSDALTDVLIPVLGPQASVLDVVEKDESAWYRSERF